MLVGHQPASQLAANFSDNLCHWNGRSAGHYEVWFLTLNHCAAKRGFWFRYAIEIPTESQSFRAPRAEVWATAFDRAAPERNFCLKSVEEISRFAFDGEEQFRLQIGDALFSPGWATGSVTGAEHHLAWDLNFTPNQTTYHHIPSRLALLAGTSSHVCSPNLNVRFSGTILEDGREILLDNEPGCQSHLWGRKRVDEWVWVHSNAFENYPDTVFEGLAARPRHAGRQLLPINSLLLRHRGEEHRFVRLRFAQQWQQNLGIGYWSFSARNTRIHIEGAAQCRLRDMLQVEYVDPDGEPLYCLNSEVANLKIRIFRRVHGLHWRHLETIHSHATTHLEHAARTLNPVVRMIE
ncbi:MAG TPA: tocopherol cyclase family protein [Blastocatellia bacterium]|nr:tocopherol cyclase family protein [Blastocatellia bacterium]